MKTKSFFSIAFMAFLLLLVITGCKEKEVVVEAKPVPPAPKSQEAFVMSLAEDIAKLQPGIPLPVTIDQSEFTTEANSATLELLPSEGEYRELKSLVKEVPLNLAWVAPESGSQLLVTSYEDFLLYKPGDKFRILDPRPVCKVTLGKSIYYLTKTSDLWKTRS